ncbi:MAG: type I restriction endonuclease subunit R [Alphaproteobacteria bacterium]
MTQNPFSESALEAEALKRIGDLGYETLNAWGEKIGSEGMFGRKTSEEVVLPVRLRAALVALNPTLPNEAIDNALYALCEGKAALSPLAANKHFYGLLKDGVLVTYKDENGIQKQERVRVIDWNNAAANDFLAVQQFKVSGEIYNCRLDLVLFINGLPLVLVELKAPQKELMKGFTDNITHYKKELPQLFWHNALIVVSNGSESRLGSLTSAWEHFTTWKKINDEGEEGIIALDTMIQGVFEPVRLLDIIENFTLFMEGKGKIIAKNHQYLGVNNTVEAVKNRKALDGKLGVFWHTQGSGKSFSMVFLTQKILRKVAGNWTFLMVTDREDLDTQIYKNFVDAGAVTEPDVQAYSRVHLKKLLSEDHRNIFTMIQKFGTAEKGESFGEISDRDDIIVITDEAHRSQYNVLAMNMRKALPHASFLAFTGTPLIKGENDEKTKEIFGGYVSRYDFKQSADDNATVRLYYENRMPELQIINTNLENDIEEVIGDAGLTEEEEERFAQKYVNMYELITRDDRLEKIGEDVVDHFMNRGFMGKAMYVALDKATAVKMYDKVQKHWQIAIEKLKTEIASCPESHRATLAEKLAYMIETDMAVVVSSAQNEIETLKKKGVDITPHRQKNRSNKDLADQFKEPENPLRIVFVCAMWITGFDAPSVSTLYLDKVLKDHTLMQTMARANRVWKDKPDGIIVDYIGIFQHLQKALATYGTAHGETDTGETPIEDKMALVGMLAEAAAKMTGYFEDKNIDTAALYAARNVFEQTALLDEVVEKILVNEKSKETFFTLAGRLKALLKAVLPDVHAEQYLKQVLTVSALAAKVHQVAAPLSSEEKARQKKAIEALALQVSALLDESITLDDYEINESKPFDITQVDFDELKERFLSSRTQKTETELLRSRIQQTIQALIEKNPMRESYLERFQALVESYNGGDVDAEKFFLELVKLSRDLKDEEQRHVREHLTEEELVVFDLLTQPEPKLSKKEIESVKAVAKELLEKLKTERLVLDWRKKQSTRAKVQNTIEEVFDILPEAYDVEIFQKKCSDVYVYVYDAYPTGDKWVRG